jgi:CBS domain-containing membrane protein
MVAADLMTPNPLTVSEATSLQAVVESMRVARVRHFPVVRGERLVGLVSQRDVLAASLSCLADVDASEREALLSSIPVSDVMVRDVVSIGPRDRLDDAVDLLLQHKFDCLPILDEGRLVGILTATDFMRLTHNLLTMTRRLESAHDAAS